MVSAEANSQFRELIGRLRKEVRIRKSSPQVSADIGYLPPDLSQMLSFLYQKLIRDKLHGKLRNGVRKNSSLFQLQYEQSDAMGE